MPRTLIAAALLTLAALTACGGSSGGNDGQTSTDVAPTFLVSLSQQSTPIVHEFAEAGNYTLTLTGSYAPAAAQPDTLNVWFSFSGQGSVSGTADPVYTVAGAGQALQVKQSIDVTLTGDGPWQITILCDSQVASGSMSALTLSTTKH